MPDENNPVYIPPEEQKRIAAFLLAKLDESKDIPTKDKLFEIITSLHVHAGSPESGIIADLVEYADELAEIAHGKHDSGWKDYAREALIEQLED